MERANPSYASLLDHQNTQEEHRLSEKHSHDDGATYARPDQEKYKIEPNEHGRSIEVQPDLRWVGKPRNVLIRDVFVRADAGEQRHKPNEKNDANRNSSSIPGC